MAFINALEPESVTVSTTPVGITTRPGGVGIKAGSALIVVEDQAIRYWLGAQNPSSSDGIEVAAGGVIELYDWQAVRTFSAVRAGGVDATLRVQPYVGW